MEFITIFLASLMGLVSPMGAIADQVVETSIRNQLYDAEELVVRFDNTPNYRYLQGQIDQVRIAGRGLYPTEGVRIAVAELETDAIAVDPNQLRQGNLDLERPLSGGVRLVLTEADVNQALRSPEVVQQLRDFGFSFAATSVQAAERYEIRDPQVNFTDEGRIQVQMNLQEQNRADDIRILLDTGVAIVAGRQLQLIDPVMQVNDQPVPEVLINLLVNTVLQGSDLRRLESRGITARLLQWEVEDEQLAIAAFIHVNPEAINAEDESEN